MTCMDVNPYQSPDESMGDRRVRADNGRGVADPPWVALGFRATKAIAIWALLFAVGWTLARLVSRSP